MITDPEKIFTSRVKPGRLLMLPGVLLFMWTACDTAPRPEVPGTPYNPEDNYQSTIVRTYPAADTSSPLLIAGDPEKTWRGEFYPNKLLFLSNGLHDTFITPADFSYALQHGVGLNPLELKSTRDSFSLTILPENCVGETALNDFISPKKIIVRLKNKVFEGCVYKVDSLRK